MSKLGLFVGVYSVIMIVLFFTFCYLMTTVNPPQVKPDPEHTRRYGSDDLIYSDEDLSNDNVAYGLEKVDDEYDSIDVFSKPLNEIGKSMPSIFIDKNYKKNCTRKEILKMVTKSIKHIKGRSINKESQQDDRIPRAVHLKIQHLDSMPRIEIRVVPDKSQLNKIRKYRSSANITNNTLKFYVDKDIKKYYDNNTKEVVVIIDNNEKLVLDFGDPVNLYDEDTSANDTSVDGFIIKDNNVDGLLKGKNISEHNINIFNHKYLNTSIKNEFKKAIINKSESNQTNTEKTTDYKSTIKSIKNEVECVTISLNSVTMIDTKSKSEFINNSSDLPTRSEDKRTDETIPAVPSNTLVGLLIPEATATLPFNYHFINK